MEYRTIEELIDVDKQTIDSKELYDFFTQKLDELFKKDKAEPLLDCAEIQYAAMIDFMYELMPTLRHQLETEKPNSN